MKQAPPENLEPPSALAPLHLALGAAVFLGLADAGWLILTWPERTTHPTYFITPPLVLAAVLLPAFLLVFTAVRWVALRFRGCPVRSALSVSFIFAILGFEAVEAAGSLYWVQPFLVNKLAPWLLAPLSAFAWSHLVGRLRKFPLISGVSPILLWIPWAVTSFWWWFWKPFLFIPIWNAVQSHVHTGLLRAAGFLVVTRILRLAGTFPEDDRARRRIRLLIIAGFATGASAGLALVAAASLRWVDTIDSPGLSPFVLAGCAGGWLIVMVTLARRGATRASWLFGGLMLLAALIPTLGQSVVSGIGRTMAKRSLTSGHGVPRVILLSIDTLRRDAVSRYNPGGNHTPNLDKLAADSIVFTHAYSSSSWTLPAFASIMTGLDPVTHGIQHPNSRLADKAVTLAERLLSEGWHTEAMGINPYLREYRNMDQGFINYRFYPDELPGRSVGIRLYRRLFPRAIFLNATTEFMADRAIGWLEEHADTDFFLWVHFFDPHSPYHPPTRFLEGNSESASYQETEEMREFYLAEARYADEQAGRVLDKLRELELYDDSLIIFLSDHGDEFEEHGDIEHGRNLFSTTTAIPLMIKLPKSRVRREVDRFVGTQSVTPTILDLLGVAYSEQDMAYPSLAPLCGPEPPADSPPAPLYQHLFSVELEFHESVLLDPWRAVFDHTNQPDNPSIYNIREDPDELRPIPNPDPGQITQFEDLLEERLEKARVLRTRLGLGAETIELIPGRVEELKKLGYL